MRTATKKLLAGAVLILLAPSILPMANIGIPWFGNLVWYGSLAGFFYGIFLIVSVPFSKQEKPPD
jgi:hypothetical protein